MSNSLDPDQARPFLGPDLGLNCLPRLSEDDTGRRIARDQTMFWKAIMFTTLSDTFLFKLSIMLGRIQAVQP